jgi:hypothetical protein
MSAAPSPPFSVLSPRTANCSSIQDERAHSSALKLCYNGPIYHHYEYVHSHNSRYPCVFQPSHSALCLWLTIASISRFRCQVPRTVARRILLPYAVVTLITNSTVFIFFIFENETLLVEAAFFDQAYMIFGRCSPYFILRRILVNLPILINDALFVRDLHYSLMINRTKLSLDVSHMRAIRLEDALFTPPCVSLLGSCRWDLQHASERRSSDSRIDQSAAFFTS